MTETPAQNAIALVEVIERVLFHGVHFESDAARDVALSLFLSLHWRPFYEGLAPLFVLDSAPSPSGAPAPGKTFLANRLAAFALSGAGSLPPTFYTRTTDEARRLFDHAAVHQMPVLRIDALDRGIPHQALATALATPWRRVRPLGCHAAALWPFRTVLIAERHGSVPQGLHPDVARRAVTSTLVAPPRPRSKARAPSSENPRDTGLVRGHSYALLRLVQSLAPSRRGADRFLLAQGFSGWCSLVDRAVRLASDGRPERAPTKKDRA